MRNAAWIYRLLALVALSAGTARAADIALEPQPAIDPPLRALEDGPTAEAHVFMLDATRTFYDMPAYSSLFGIECTRERDNRLAYNLAAQWAAICLADMGWQPVSGRAEVVIVYGRYEHYKVEPEPRGDSGSPRDAGDTRRDRRRLVHGDRRPVASARARMCVQS